MKRITMETKAQFRLLSASKDNLKSLRAWLYHHVSCPQNYSIHLRKLYDLHEDAPFSVLVDVLYMENRATTIEPPQWVVIIEETTMANANVIHIKTGRSPEVGTTTNVIRAYNTLDELHSALR